MLPSIDICGLSLKLFPVILEVAIILCIIVYCKSSKYDHFYHYDLRFAAFYCFIGAGVGGKALYALTRISTGTQTIVSLLGGFVFFGGMLGGLIGVYIYSWKYRRRFLDLIDVFASLLPLGQSIGRLGCFCNGCCYGKAYRGLFAVHYRVNGNIITVFPTWFCESLFCLLLFSLMFIISRPLYSGLYASLYMISYSVFRFIMEYWRGDSVRGVWMGISTSQHLSIVVFAMGIMIMIRSLVKKDNNMIIVGRKNHANKCFSMYL